MEGASTLELIAELAIGLLGFSGIIAALARSGAGQLNLIDRARFSTMVLLGALAEVLALLPFALYHSGLESHALWGWASGLGAVALILFQRGIYRGAPGFTVRRAWSDPSVNKLAVVVGVAGSWTFVPVLALNATGILFERAFAPYLLAVMLAFSQALYAFVRLLSSAVGERSTNNNAPHAST